MINKTKQNKKNKNKNKNKERERTERTERKPIGFLQKKKIISPWWRHLHNSNSCNLPSLEI